MNRSKLDIECSVWEWQSDEDDLKKLSRQCAARILFDIFLINEFEHAVLRLKKDNCVWGPVHSSIGQEAVAAATVAALRQTDKFLATHRSHHQFLAKALHFAIPQSWDPVSDELPEAGREVIRKTLAEIMGLADGYCGGRGGSMHLRYPEAGFLGSNAIVGGGIPISTGAAFAEKFNKTENVVVCFFGDGAVNQGSFHEACNLAGAWKLPLIFLLENNQYAVATSVDKASAIGNLSIRALSYGMDGHVVDGNDPTAIYNLVKNVAEEIRHGNGPCFIEAKCYRRYHHAGDQPGSVFGYRSEEEEESWSQKEVIIQFPKDLVAAGVFTEIIIARIKEMAVEAVLNSVDACTIAGTPRKVPPELYPSPETAEKGLRSDGREWNNITFSEREHFSSFITMKYSDAIATATGRWLEKDLSAFVLGEEVANFGGGAYNATKGLPIRFPDRVLNTPISEAGFVGLSLGAAMSGLHPIIEIMFPDFTLVAADQIFNQIAKARHMYGNTTNLPLIARTRLAVGCGYGGQHSMDPIGLYALFPGWRIVAPATSFDYIGLFNSAMQSLDPVLIMEHHSLYEKKFPVPEDNLDYFIRFGKARVVTDGEDATIVAYGAMTNRCEIIQERLTYEGLSVGVIDLRSVDLQSIDYETIGKSVKKTGVVIVVEEAPLSHSIGATISATITKLFFDYLDSPVVHLTSLDIPNPVSRVLEAAAILSDQKIVDAIKAAVRLR